MFRVLHSFLLLLTCARANMHMRCCLCVCVCVYVCVCNDLFRYWKPGDALPDSLTEMLAYFKLRGVKPVAYVYPILAFLAGTLPGGKSPPWIVPGVYDLPKVMGGGPARLTHGEYEAMLDQNTAKGNGGNTVLTGPLRANLASPEFQEWLPRTMAAFAKATGAGGFSFDYTYFEEPESIGSQYAQWAGWRSILHRLHIADGGKACAGGTSCVVDNRQQNHVWGTALSHQCFSSLADTLSLSVALYCPMHADLFAVAIVDDATRVHRIVHRIKGPWMWAQGGTYAEPLMSDEQPGSWMFYEADLHTDRLSANEERCCVYARACVCVSSPLYPYFGVAFLFHKRSL